MSGGNGRHHVTVTNISQGRDHGTQTSQTDIDEHGVTVTNICNGGNHGIQAAVVTGSVVITTTR